MFSRKAVKLYQHARESFKAHTFRASEAFSLPYRLYQPDYREPGRKYPVVLFLHAADERGSDNERQLKWGVHQFITPPTVDQFPAFIVAPQCPLGQRWVEVDWTLPSHTMPESMSRPLRATLELLNHLCNILPVEPRRQYVTGMSMGGFGTWDLIQRFPDRFAAAVPVCGGGDLGQAPRLVGLPIRAFHGGDDEVVNVRRSRDMVHAIRMAGGTPYYTEYEGLGHACWKQAYREDELFEWLFTRKKAAGLLLSPTKIKSQPSFRRSSA